MQKEKKVRTYTRKSKTGKTVTVKAHTAKYDAAEEARKAFAKKAGAGSELAKTKQEKVKPMADDDLGFTEADYKAWYHWDTEDDPKNTSALKVKKALIAKMGRSAYNKYEKQMTDSYSARGHLKAFKGVGDVTKSDTTKGKSSTSEKTAGDALYEVLKKETDSQLRGVGIDPDKRVRGKKATAAKKDLIAKGFVQTKDGSGHYILTKGSESYKYTPGAGLVGGAVLDRLINKKPSAPKKVFTPKTTEVLYNPKTNRPNIKAIEKKVGYKLSHDEREYAQYYYESGGKGVPDFGSERHQDFLQLL